MRSKHAQASTSSRFHKILSSLRVAVKYHTQRMPRSKAIAVSTFERTEISAASIGGISPYDLRAHGDVPPCLLSHHVRRRARVQFSGRDLKRSITSSHEISSNLVLWAFLRESLFTVMYSRHQSLDSRLWKVSSVRDHVSHEPCWGDIPVMYDDASLARKT